MSLAPEQVAQLLRPINPRRIFIDSNGCWIWRGAIGHNGYGVAWIGRAKQWRVHRWTYTNAYGPIPGEAEIDHLCRVRACCNPAHLEAVTRAENARRGVWPNAQKTHCPQGHPYTPDNVYLSKKGSRTCRTCALERARLQKLRRKAAA